MKKDYGKLAQDIVAGVGGAENVKSLTHCITRLRFVLRDESKADKNRITALNGVVSVIQAGGQYQVVIGNEVNEVFDATGKIPGIHTEMTAQGGNGNATKEKKNILNMLMDTISGIFMPCMPVMMGCGIMKSLLLLLTTFSILSTESVTYTILYAIGDSFYYFMPLFLGVSAAKKFGSNANMGLAVGCSFLYPTLLTLVQEGQAVDFLGIPFTLLNYSNTVMPIIIAVYAMSKFEKGI